MAGMLLIANLKPFLGCMYLLVELLGSCKRKPLYLTRLVLHSILKISYFENQGSIRAEVTAIMY